jgi:hypothetical protein
MKKLRDLGSREDRNILEFKIDKMLSDKQFPALRALNSFSFRSFSFTVFIRKEGFTDPFFKFLDFLGRNAEVS